MEIIRFDERSSAWSNNVEYNKAFLRQQRNYIMDIVMARGYIYLNQIYEILGAEWLPKRYNNVCFYADTILYIDIEPSKEHNCWLVKIHQV